MRRQRNANSSSWSARRRRRFRLRLRLGALFVIAALAAASGSLAYFTTHASSTTGSATVGNLTAATIRAPSNSNAHITITWDQQAAMTPTSQNSGIKYTVMRSYNGGAFSAVATGPCSGALSFGIASCADTVPVTGTY